MQSRLNMGEVTVALGGKEFTLKPTISAMRSINRVYEGLGGAVQALVKANFDAVVTVIRYGANLEGKALRNLDDLVFDEMGRDEAAFGELLIQLIKFVRILQNGGKPLKEDLDNPPDDNDNDGEPQEGNRY